MCITTASICPLVPAQVGHLCPLLAVRNGTISSAFLPELGAHGLCLRAWRGRGLFGGVVGEPGRGTGIVFRIKFKHPSGPAYKNAKGWEEMCFREPWSLCAFHEACEAGPAIGESAQCMQPWKVLRLSASPFQIGFDFNKHLPGPLPCRRYLAGVITTPSAPSPEVPEPILFSFSRYHFELTP